MTHNIVYVGDQFVNLARTPILLFTGEENRALAGQLYRDMISNGRPAGCVAFSKGRPAAEVIPEISHPGVHLIQVNTASLHIAADPLDVAVLAAGVPTSAIVIVASLFDAGTPLPANVAHFASPTLAGVSEDLTPTRVARLKARAAAE